MKYLFGMFQITFLSFVLLLNFLTTVSLSAEVAADTNAQKAGEIVRKMVDKGLLTQAERWIKQAPKTIQSSVPVLYQRARIVLKTNYMSIKGYIGYRYTPTGAKEAIQLLNKAIALDPKNANNYSLSGHIYAVQGENKLAQDMFKKADGLTPKPLWLDFNKALLAINMKNMKEAARLFRNNTHRNIKQNKSDPYLQARNNIYRSSWDIWKNISIDFPEVDALSSVRKGLIKRVFPHQLVNYINSRKKTDKPVFVHFSSSDDFCQPCLESNKGIEKIAEELKAYYDFVVVSFESWNLVRDFPSLLKPDKLKGLPAQVVFINKKSAGFQMGNICPKSTCKTTIQMLTNLAKKK